MEKIKKYIKLELLKCYSKYMLSFFEFNYKYPFNRIRYIINPKKVIKHLKEKLNELEYKFNEIDKV